MMYQQAHKRTHSATECKNFQLKINQNRKSKGTSISHLLPIFSFSLFLIFLSFDISKAANVERLHTQNISISNSSEICKHPNETAAAEKLQRVCEDCSNLIQSDTLRNLCSSECYSSIYFTSCLLTICYWDESKAYRLLVEKLSGNKFEEWHYDEVRIEGANQTTTRLSTNVTKGVCS